MDRIKTFFTKTLKDRSFTHALISIALLLLIYYLFILTSVSWKSILQLIVAVVQPFFIAYTLSFILSPIVKMVDDKIHNRGRSILLVALGVLVFVILTIVIAIPSILGELKDFLNAGVQVTSSFITNLKNNNFYGLESILKNLNIDVWDYVNIGQITKYTTSILGTSTNIIISLLANAVVLFLQGLVTLILAIYFLINEDVVKQAVKKASAKLHPNLPRYLRNASIEAQRYIKMFAIVMLSKLPQYLLLFYIFGHRSWFLLGVLNMFAVLVPYIGPVFVNFLALITALTQGPVTIFGTIFIIFWSSFIDQYFIMPKIYKSQININILVLLFGMFANSTIFGLIGVIIAIPQILIIRSIIQTRKQIKLENSI